MLRRIVAAAASVLMLASCGLADGGADGPTEITYWSWVAGSQEIVDRFNATHDDIQVNFEQIPAGTSGGYSKMFNAVRAGRAPDVATVEYPQMPGFVTQNVIQPITRYGVEDLAGEYPEWAWRQAALGDEVYGLPKDVAPTVLFYRSDLFEEYGLQPPTTWDEYRATAEQLQERNPEAAITTFSTADAGLVSSLAWQAGADWFDTSTGTWALETDDPATTRMTEYWDGLIADGLVNAEPTYAEKHINDLNAGTSLTLLAAPWSAANLSRFVPELAGKWGVAPLPTWDGQPRAGNYGGSVMTLPVGSPHPDEAMEFARWVSTSPDAVEAASTMSTAFPANVNLADAWGAATEAAMPYVQGMNLTAVAREAALSIDPAWEWGPDMTNGFQRLNDRTGAAVGSPGGLTAALRRWHDDMLDEMRQRGYEVTG
ncbi:ABC transporter substrate-binding protein [Streptomyces avicenniae]|uniref:ABC transporter substrate-binding protein n=1 Tax=Streptomyces avicenniae TaxID=500153 RepID=UPI00069B43D2|nr:sugar ABC transporter substrate-binding protein [Streptomyces avicenniae]